MNMPGVGSCLSISTGYRTDRPGTSRWPSGAYQHRDDGIVVLDGERCLGCRYCEMACPFGAPVFDEEAGIMRKCDFCCERIDRGLSPACVTACPVGALDRLTDDEKATAHDAIPGFVDPAGCRPSLRFGEPGGALRVQRQGQLRKEMKE